MIRTTGWRSGLASVLMLAAIAPAHAGGFRVEAQGAAALGQGLAFTAAVEDPTAIYYNPAGLTALPGTQVAVFGNWITTSARFTNLNATPPFIAADQREDDQNPSVFPSGLYVTNAIWPRVNFGLGIFAPYGLALDRASNGNTQFTMTHARLQTIDVNPIVALQLHPMLSLAVGLDLIGAVAELDRAVLLPPPAPPGTASRFTFRDGTDFAVGSTVSLGGTPLPGWRWGVVYRSAVRLNLDGRAHVDATTITSQIDDDATIALTLPLTLAAGAAYEPTPSWLVTADGVWTDWSSTDRLDLSTSNALLANHPASKSRRAWRDTWGARVGTRYHLGPGWTVRAGYYWNPTPVPGSTLDSLLPDANRHELGVGAGYAWERTRVDLAYSHLFVADRTTETNVNDASAVGIYHTRLDVVALTLSYSF
jgi:long-chain fatty acid transport protein